MAVYQMPCFTYAGSIPRWAVEASKNVPHRLSYPQSKIYSLKDGLHWNTANDNFWETLPILSNLPVDNFEALGEFSYTDRGSANHINTGGVFFIGDSKGENLTHGYTINVGSGSSSFISAYIRNPGSQQSMGSKSISASTVSVGNKFKFRVRREIGFIGIRIWPSQEIEPESWDITTNNETYKCDYISLLNNGSQLSFIVHRLSIATDGDIAEFNETTVRRVLGVAKNPSEHQLVTIYNYQNNEPIAFVEPDPITGVWHYDLLQDIPIYASYHDGEKLVYDFIFARLGPGFLAGSYPDGQTTVEGVPAAADVEVRLRGSGVFSGITIAKTKSKQDGTWSFKGLTEDSVFDVVGKLDGFNDVIMSSIKPEVASGVVLSGSTQKNRDSINAIYDIYGGSEPYSIVLNGQPPYGLSSGQFVIGDGTLQMNYASREYGDFDFSFTISDSENSSFTEDISIRDLERAEFADLVGSVTPPDRVSSGDMTLAVPENTQPDDLMVVAVLHRAPITVTDSNGGEWKLEGTSGNPTVNEQWTSVYTRRASAGDASAVITVSCPTSGRLIPWLAVFRGRYLPLKVVSVVDGVAALGGAQPIPLTPVEHSSGLIVRCVSWYFASTTTTSTRAILSGMHNVGPQAGTSEQGQLRLQIGYTHESAPGEQNSSLDSNVSNTDNAYPEVILIIDEDRS